MPIGDKTEARDPDSGGAARDANDAHPWQAAHESHSTPPAPPEPSAAIWCAWRAEPDAKTGPVTKRPYRIRDDGGAE